MGHTIATCFGILLALVATLCAILVAYAPLAAVFFVTDPQAGERESWLLVGLGVVAGLLLSAWSAQRLLSLTRIGRLIIVAIAFVFLTLAIIVGLVTVALAAVVANDASASVFVLPVGLSVAALYAVAARRMVRRGRRLVLFLRRFRFALATDTVSAVATGWVGASWRVVTLDDDSVAPIGAARKNRYLSLVAVVLGLLATPAAATYYLSSATRSPGVIVLTIVGAFLAVIAGIVGLAASASAWRAQRQSRVVVRKPSQVVRQARRVAKRSRHVMAPRLVLCRVETPLWQAMVSAFLYQADAVVVDLSDPTESVVWEVDLLRRNPARRRVLICHKDLAAPLVDQSRSAAGSAHHHVVPLLDGQEVLLYGTTDPEIRSFARALQQRLR